MNDYDARLCIATSEQDADIYYATGFLVPDPFIFFEKNGKKFVVLSDLEIERGKRDARVDEVISLTTHQRCLQEQGIVWPKLIDIADSVLREYQIHSVLVPGSFPLQYADPLRERGYTVQYKDPFFETRMIKTSQEIDYIRQTQQKNEAALDHIMQIICESKIGANDELYYRGTTLTSEFLRQQIETKLLELDCLARDTIISSGDQATRPHERGSGHLRAHQAIIIDVFPQSSKNRYFADMTRTVVKGKASDELKRMYQAVLAAQEIAFKSLRAGVKGYDVHQQIQDMFTREGFETGEQNGAMQGFFHGTGHGLGLEIHEPPRVGKTEHVLQAGNVVTVEPGLYYLGIGGVRLEDMVVITATGCLNLTTYPKELEVV
jgi:Xaa-Pro aminopeptidase